MGCRVAEEKRGMGRRKGTEMRKILLSLRVKSRGYATDLSVHPHKFGVIRTHTSDVNSGQTFSALTLLVGRQEGHPA